MPLVFTLTLAAAIAVPKPSALPRIAAHAAPADSYFGRTKLSALGIRNEIALLARRHRERMAADADLVHDATIAQAALDEWQRRFPKDPWVTPTRFHLEQLYAEIQTTGARARATALLHEIAHDDPTSREAHLSRIRLAEGFPSFQADTASQTTPSPYGSAGPTAMPASRRSNP
jgi:hypothetical protein